MGKVDILVNGGQVIDGTGVHGPPARCDGRRRVGKQASEAQRLAMVTLLRRAWQLHLLLDAIAESSPNEVRYGKSSGRPTSLPTRFARTDLGGSRRLP